VCGAQLKERKRKKVRLPQGDVLLPLLLIVALAALWLWKPWQSRKPQAMVESSSTPTATLPPTATYVVAPTATPLNSPTPEATATLPPNQVRHIIESGETASSIARVYGTTVSAILRINGLNERSILSVGDELIIPLPIADTATPTPTLTPSPTPFLYTIRTADTLSAIAKRFNTTVEALMEANGITDATRIRVGTQITIVQPPDYSSTMAYETYEVQQGDTLYTLSAKYGLTIAEIKEINDLQSDALSIGQQLRIPVGTATPTPTLTPSPTLTPTPGPPWPAPVLLSPPDGTIFEGPDTIILLAWASVGILSEDEWYVLSLQELGGGAEQVPPVWTKTTSWRLPQDLYDEGQAEGLLFRWQVFVMRQTEVAEDGTRIGEEISPPGEIRTFSWK
jgi:LysM repeat protein